MFKYVRQALKAVFATLVAFVGSLVTVLAGGDANLGDITDGQWLSAVLVGLVAGGGVYGLSNTPK